MVKKVLLVLAILVTCVFVVGNVTLVAADDPIKSPPATQPPTTPPPTKVRPPPAFNSAEILAIKDEATLDKALADLLAAGKITPEGITKIKSTWLRAHTPPTTPPPTKIAPPPAFNSAEILAIKDEATLDKALADLLAAGKITPEGITKIKSTWLRAHTPPTTTSSTKVAPLPAFNSAEILAIQDIATLDKALADLLAAGKITPEGIIKIKSTWLKNHGAG